MTPPFSIEFETTKKDFLEGIQFVYKHSKENRRARWLASVFYGFLAWLSFSHASKRHDALIALITSAVVVLLVAISASLLQRVFNFFIFRSLIPKNKKNGILGWHELTIESDSITEKTEVNESKFKWVSVPKILKTPKYILLYQTEISAHIIPKRIFNSDDEFEEFYNMLTALKNDAQRERVTILLGLCLHLCISLTLDFKPEAFEQILE